MTPRRLYLAEWRKHYRISRATVAKRCGVDTYTVTRWENGKRQITAAKIAAYGHAIGIPNIGWLWQHPDEVLRDAVMRAVTARTGMQALHQAKAQLTPHRPPLLTRIRDFLSAFFRKHQAKGA